MQKNVDPGTHVDVDVTTKSEPDYNLTFLRIVRTQFAHSSNKLTKKVPLQYVLQYNNM